MSETSVDNLFTRQYNPEDSSEHHTRRRENLKSHIDIFKPTIGNESSHEIINDNGVKVVNFATSKNLVVKSTMFPIAAFINTPGPLLMDRRTTILITF
jgi:hypothetical protein